MTAAILQFIISGQTFDADKAVSQMVCSFRSALHSAYLLGEDAYNRQTHHHSPSLSNTLLKASKLTIIA